MNNLWSKAITAVVVVAGASLGLTGTASAALPSVQLEICSSRSSSTANFTVSGRNQNNAQVTYPTFSLRGNQCRTLSGWWWRTGQSVRIVKGNVTYFDTIESDVADGTRITVGIA